MSEKSPVAGGPRTELAEPGSPEFIAARNRRNLALGGALLLFVIVVFVVSWIRMSANTPH